MAFVVKGEMPFYAYEFVCDMKNIVFVTHNFFFNRFHYIFNLRDLSRITHGMCLTTAERFEKPESFIRCWRNEVLRIFYDRLTNNKDKELVEVRLSS